MTTDSLETLDALIGRYVAGALPTPARVLCEAHLMITSASRPFAAGLEALAGNALEDVAPVAFDRAAGRLESIFAATGPTEPSRQSGTTGLFPKPLRDFIGFDVEDVPWRTKLPGFKEFDLGESDGCHAHLFWLRPGRSIPAHTHEGTELFLVLDGAFTDRFGRYARGDVSIADDSVDHRPVAEKERPCIGFSVTDGDLRLTGPIHRRLSDILGL